MKFQWVLIGCWLVLLSSCQTFGDLFGTSNPKDSETAESVGGVKNNDWSRIPAGPMDTEEILIAQAKDAALKQAERRAEMAKQRRIELMTERNEPAETSKTETREIPSITKLQEEQAKEAAKRLLEKRAALARTKSPPEPSKLPETPLVETTVVEVETPLKEEVVTTPPPTPVEKLPVVPSKEVEKTFPAEPIKKVASTPVPAKEVVTKPSSTPVVKEVEATPPVVEATVMREEEKVKVPENPVVNEASKEAVNETEKQRASRFARQNLQLSRETEKAKWAYGKKKTPPVEAEVKEVVVEEDPAMSDIISEDEPSIPTKADMPPIYKKYFFPIEQMEAARAYRYISDETTPDTSYWLMKTLKFNEQTFFITEVYNGKLQLKSASRESVTEVGVFLEDFTSYETNKMGIVQSIVYWVEDNESYKWGMKVGGKAILTLNYNSVMHPNVDITSYRERKKMAGLEKFSFGGNLYETITFEDKKTTTYTDHKNEEEFYASSYINQFAEGIGLVEFIVNEQDKGHSVLKTYKLDKILDYDEWQELLKWKKK